MTFSPVRDVESFWQKTTIGEVPSVDDDPLRQPLTSPCWLWTGRTNWKGYGQVWAFMKSGKWSCRNANAVAWEIANSRALPNGHHTDHLCRVPRCVNPEHLELVTAGENVRRGKLGSKEWWQSPEGQEKITKMHASRAPWTPDQIEQIRIRAVARLTPEQRERYEERRAWHSLPKSERAKIVAEDLRLRTQTEEHRAARRGSKNAACKLTEEQVLMIKRDVHIPSSEFAKQFGVSRSMIHAIRSGRKWGWLKP